MAKRFTDSDKWEHEWFHKLNPRQKLLWLFLCDVCNGVGIWKVNFSLATFMIGEEVTWKDIDAIGLGKRLIKLGEDEIWIVGFIKFQYKNLSPKNHAHLGMMRTILKSVGHLPLSGESREIIEFFKTLLSEKNPQESTSPNDPQQTVRNESTDSTGKGNGKGNGKGKVIKGGVGEKSNSSAALEVIYKKHYPRKEGKSEGIKKLLTEIKTDDDIMQFESAVVKYANHIKANKTETRYTKKFSSFVNCWRDWLDDDAGSGVAAKNYQNETETDHDAELREAWAV